MNEQLAALALVIADLRLQIAQLAHENNTLRERWDDAEGLKGSDGPG